MAQPEDKTDWLGNPYTEHVDAEGKKIGESREATDSFNNPYTEHVDAESKKIGESREAADFFNNPYTEHIGPRGEERGRSYGTAPSGASLFQALRPPANLPVRTTVSAAGSRPGSASLSWQRC